MSTLATATALEGGLSTQTEPSIRLESPSARIAGLDGLRGISILLVLYGHALATRAFPSSRFLARFEAIGILGVQIFFVISGFLITHLLLREKQRSGTISLKKYYARRSLRILPVFAVFMLVVVLARIAGLVDVDRASLIAASLFVMNFVQKPSWAVGHTWSLSVEEQFYLIWPFILKRSSTQRCIRLCFLAIVAVPLVRCLIFRYDPDGASLLSRLAPQFADCLAMGCLFALRLPDLKASEPVRRLLSSRLCLAAFPIMVLINALWIRPDVCPKWITLPVGQACISFLAALLIARLVLLPTSLMRRALTFPPLAFIGVISYSLYVWQQIFLDRTSHHAWNAFPVNLAASFLAAVLSYLFIERSSARLKNRFV
jgi:peptidoglycan/LPS O-acetylase OafA/YrhL